MLLCYVIFGPVLAAFAFDVILTWAAWMSPFGELRLFYVNLLTPFRPLNMIITSKKSTSSLDGSTSSVKPATAGSICRPVSEQEAQTIDDLRTVVPSLKSVDDAYVLRWLRWKEGRFDEAAEGLRKNMTFRKAWDLDHIGQWTAPEVSWSDRCLAKEKFA